MTETAPSNTENEYWRKLIEELQEEGFTLEQIAAEINVSERQVSNWKTGDRPKGLSAVRLYLFHVKCKQKVNLSS